MHFDKACMWFWGMLKFGNHWTSLLCYVLKSQIKLSDLVSSLCYTSHSIFCLWTCSMHVTYLYPSILWASICVHFVHVGIIHVLSAAWMCMNYFIKQLIECTIWASVYLFMKGRLTGSCIQGSTQDWLWSRWLGSVVESGSGQQFPAFWFGKIYLVWVNSHPLQSSLSKFLMLQIFTNMLCNIVYFINSLVHSLDELLSKSYLNNLT